LSESKNLKAITVKTRIGVEQKTKILSTQEPMIIFFRQNKMPRKKPAINQNIGNIKAYSSEALWSL
jgi:hypothetical protein